MSVIKLNCSRYLSFHRTIVLSALALVCFASDLTGQIQENIEKAESAPRRVHFILYGLTKDNNIGTAIGVSLRDLEQLLRIEVDKEYIASFTIVKDDDCNAEKILNTVRDIKINNIDTLYCYYAGHGAYDSSYAINDPSKGHFFAIPSGDLFRKSLFIKCKKKEPD